MEPAMPFNTSVGTFAVVAALVAAAVALAAFRMPQRSAPEQPAFDRVMLILRGIANPENPRGQLDDPSALEYARRLGFRGDVLDVAGDTDGDTRQVPMALDRIRRDETVTAIYGFSGGGYNARLIWKELTAAERERIRKVIVVGAPEVSKADFPGSSDVLIKADPPQGHMAGPKALLESLDPERAAGG
jgi:hypothetical protein